MNAEEIIRQTILNLQNELQYCMRQIDRTENGNTERINYYRGRADATERALDHFSLTVQIYQNA
jgi:hypothetical protein